MKTERRIGIVNGVDIDGTVQSILSSVLYIAGLADDGFVLSDISTQELVNLNMCLKGAECILKERGCKDEDC